MYYQDTAISLKRVNHHEDDLLVTFYTQKYGKIITLVQGGKKIKSKLAGHIEPMNLIQINWVIGKNAEKLIGAHVLKSYKKIKENYEKIFLGLYFLEVIDKTIKTRHPDIKIFDFLKNVLTKLENVEIDHGNLISQKLELIKLCFDYKILFLLGYSPVNRKHLDAQSKNIIQKIINMPVDLIKINLERDILDNLSIKAKEFLSEVAGEIKFFLSS